MDRAAPGRFRRTRLARVEERMAIRDDAEEVRALLARRTSARRPGEPCGAHWAPKDFWRTASPCARLGRHDRVAQEIPYQKPFPGPDTGPILGSMRVLDTFPAHLYYWQDPRRQGSQSAFACIHDRAQNAAMQRLFELRESGKLCNFILPYLGQDDSRLKFLPADLVTREEAYVYPTMDQGGHACRAASSVTTPSGSNSTRSPTISATSRGHSCCPMQWSSGH